MRRYWPVIAIIVLLLGAVGWYGISPLFNPLVTDEAAPDDAQLTATTTETDTSVPMTQTPTPSPRMELRGDIVGTPAHPASGTVRIVSADGTQYVRYENLKTINGPDIYVYLAKDTGAKEFVSLGKVKSTEGNSNYEIPAGVNPAEYRYVLIWCKQFGVLFNSAELKPTG